MPFVSVIIPNYNRAELVCKTVDNMLRQSLSPHEVIVVDDGSTDDSVRLLKDRFADRIILICQENVGPGAARNAGLKIATGEYIQLMDSDDLSSLNKLETQVEALQRNKADLVYSPWIKIEIIDNNIKIQDVVLQQQPLPKDRDILTWFMTDWSNVFQQCLFRRSLLEKAGMFLEDLFCGEDGELFVRMLLSEPIICFDDRSLTLYRINSGDKLTDSSKNNCRRLADWTRAYLLMQSHTQQYSPRLAFHPDVLYRVWEARQSLYLYCKEEKGLIESCDTLLDRKPENMYQLRSIKNRVKLSIQQRLKGHRWSKAYQASRIRSQQQALIHQLGFNIVASR